MRPLPLLIALVIAAGNFTAYPRAVAQVNSDRTEEIIRQSAICANNIPGEGLERRGEYLIGWLNVLVSGRHRIEVPGATQVVVNSDIPKTPGAPNSFVVADLKQGVYVKFISKIPAGAPFQPRWTMPNGLEWGIPDWAMYSMTKGSQRVNTLVLPALTQRAKP